MKTEHPHPEDWQDEAPLLAGLPKRKPGGVPEGYFDQLPAQVMARIQADGPAQSPATTPAETPTRTLGRKPGWAPPRLWAAAAAVVVLAVAAYILWPAAPHDSTLPEDDFHAQLAAFDDEDILNALSTRDVNPDEVMALLGDDAGDILEVEGHSDDLLDYLEHEDLESFDLGDLDIDPNSLL